MVACLLRSGRPLQRGAAALCADLRLVIPVSQGGALQATLTATITAIMTTANRWPIILCR